MKHFKNTFPFALIALAYVALFQVYGYGQTTIMGSALDASVITPAPAGTTPVGTSGITATQIAYGSGVNQIKGSSQLLFVEGDSEKIANTVTNGLQIYNTADQTSVYQRLEALYTGGVATIRTSFGSGSSSTILSLEATGVAGGTQPNQFQIRTGGTGNGQFRFNGVTNGTTGGIGAVFNFAAVTASSGTSVGVSILPVWNMSATGAATDVLINETGTAYGSGLQSFSDQQIGGTSWYWQGHGNQATTGAFNSSSAVENAVIWAPNFGSQTSTAGWNAFTINPSSGAGSGVKNILLLQIGGTTAFRVSSAGNAIATGGIYSISAAGGIGYQTGSGGAVTQATNRTTPVTLNNVTGAITTNTTSLGALALATFTVNDTAVAIGDCVILTVRSGQTNVGTLVYVTAVAAGSFNITVDNTNGVTPETGAIIINFAVIKAVSS